MALKLLLLPLLGALVVSFPALLSVLGFVVLVVEEEALSEELLWLGLDESVLSSALPIPFGLLELLGLLGKVAVDVGLALELVGGVEEFTL